MNTVYVIDNIPLLFISIVIVFVQYFVFRSTCGKISVLNRVLSNKQFRVGTIDNGEDFATEISIDDKRSNPVTKEIESSINTYLLRNKGAVSDFNLIKDIVERNCDTLASEIESQTSMPLYIGLIGTVAGIVIGLGTLALKGENLGDPSCIMALMVGVAFAMIASGCGVLFTSISIWKSKKCSATLENNKNRFYTWIQTELLPVLSSSTVSTLSLLERNLTNFNNSFSKTVKQLDDKLSDVGDLYSSQIELLDRIEKIDIHKMATANIKILETLTRSSDKLENFAQYMEQTTEYLTAVKELNGKIDEHLERTEALGVISDFYKKQMDEIALRQNAIKLVATDVDDIVKKALSDLASNTSTGLQGLQTVYTKQNEIMTSLANEQGNALKSAITKLDAVIMLSKELQEVPKIISMLSLNAQKQSSAINELAKAVSRIQQNGGSSRGFFLTRWIGSLWRWLKSLVSFGERETYKEYSDFSPKSKTPYYQSKDPKVYSPKKINRLK